MKRKVVAALLVVAIAASGAVGYYLGSYDVSHYISSTQSAGCNLAPRGSTLYIRTTLDDGTTPVTNVTIDAIPVETCNGVDTTIAILLHPAVNASGIATLDASYDTFYSLVVHYRSQNHLFTAVVVNNPITCASLTLPSGSLTISSCWNAPVPL